MIKEKIENWISLTFKTFEFQRLPWGKNANHVYHKIQCPEYVESLITEQKDK